MPDGLDDLSFEAKEGSVHTAPVHPPRLRPDRPARAQVELPCSLLARELGAVVADPPTDMRREAPLGSIVEMPREVSAALRELGPATLQVYACLLELWQLRADADGVAACTVPEVLRWLGRREGAHGGFDSEQRRQVLLAAHSLASVEFLRGPKGEGVPGAPLELLETSGRTLAFQPSPSWLVPGWQVARVSRRLYDFHPRNDRYRILLLWHLALMLRINRKHGYRYRVSLGRLLRGAGIAVPSRNRGRFLASIYGALDDLPEITFHGPRFTLFAADELLASTLEFELTIGERQAERAAS